MKIGQLICVCIVLINSTKAQNIDDFKVLVSEGELPVDINISSSEKVEEQSRQVTNSGTPSEVSSEKKFIIQSNYLIDKMLSSGIVLYGEKLSRYVEKVADELLKNDLELRNKLRFYIVKTPQVNAFATDRGEIFITVGLLAQIENEAQLAFVLSHELIHFINKHAKTGFVENEKIEKSNSKYAGTDWNKVLSKSKYSKELELEADQEGLELYLKSNYSIKEINAVFYVLQYAHLPFDDLPFNKDYFNDEYLVLHPSKENRDVAKIEAIDDEDDKYQNHPNINKRRAIVQNEIEGKPNTGKLEFINSKEEFFEVQSLSRFELSFLYAKNRFYGEAIYNSYLLLKNYPDNKFLKINIGYCLYALAKYKNGSKINDVLSDYSDVQGESQNVFYLFDKIEKEELNVLAVKYLWGLKNEIKDDKFLNRIASDAIKEMLFESGVRKSDFSKTMEMELVDDKNDSTVQSKYDKIKNKQKEEGTPYEFSFIKLFEDEEFSELLNRYEKAYVEKVKNVDEDEFDNKKNEKKALGINNTVMVSPDYRHFMAKRRKFYEEYIYGEKKEEEFISLNKSIAKKKNVALKIISNQQYNSTEEFNDMSLLNFWMEERYGHFNMKIYPYCGMYTEELVSKYGTKYFTWSGIYSFQVGKKGLGWSLLGSYVFGVAAGAVSLAALPVGAAIPLGLYFSGSSKRSFYYTYLFDISNYNALLINENYKKAVPMNLYISDSFNQISMKKRNKN